MYAWVHKVRIRKAPGFKGAILGHLDERERVRFLGEKSSFRSSVTLRGRKFASPWLKIKTEDGQVGWVYGGALRPVEKVMENVLFAISDGGGKNLLTLHTNEGGDFPAAPPSVNRAVCGGSKVLVVKFKKRQKGAPDFNGRINVRNFRKSPGLLYEVQGRASRGTECLVGPIDYFASRRALGFVAVENKRSSRQLVRRIEKTKKRRVVRSHVLIRTKSASPGRVPSVGRSSLPQGPASLHLVLFQRKGRNVMASLVYARGEGLAFRDFPAVIDKNGHAWRVDDSGMILREMFRVHAVLAGPRGTEIAVSWIGAEGAYLFLLRRDESIFYEIREGYRYNAPP